MDSPLCTFCKKEEESLEHLLFYCKIVDLFWKELLSWIAIYKDEVVEISLIDLLFGIFDFKAMNHILLLAKFYIYRCKLEKINPNIYVFRAKVRATYNLELFIAKKKDDLLKHYTKWELFISILS